jgi:hypothetical protein
MPEVVLPNWLSEGLLVALVAVLALIAFAAVRAAIHVAARHLIEARAGEAAEESPLARVELERRVSTLERLAWWVASSPRSAPS